MCIQPTTFAFSHWTDEWLEVQKVNDIQSHRTNKWPTTIWTDLLLEIKVSFQGTLSHWLLQVSAAPWYFSHLFPGRPWSLPAGRLELLPLNWGFWIHSLSPQHFLQTMDLGKQPDLRTFHLMTKMKWKHEPYLSYESCWYNKAEVTLQRHDVYICLLRGETHVQSAAIHHC